MPASVIVYLAPTNRRSRICASAMMKGVAKVGDRVRMLHASKHEEVSADVAVFYGLADGLAKVFRDYKREAKAVYIDLGYWQRRLNTRYDGHHKFAVNSRHPTAYFQKRRGGDGSRFAALGQPIRPWQHFFGSRAIGHIVVAGMSAKAAAAEGLKPEQWEREAVARLQTVTGRPIVYRPKPNWSGASAIPGAIFQRDVSIENALRGCHAVVTHHSNFGVEALVAGVPCFCVEGVAVPMASSDLSRIDEPFYPEARERWAEDIAWCQWSVAEMAEGLPWKFLKDEGLIP